MKVKIVVRQNNKNQYVATFVKAPQRLMDLAMRGDLIVPENGRVISMNPAPNAMINVYYASDKPHPGPLAEYFGDLDEAYGEWADFWWDSVIHDDKSLVIQRMLETEASQALDAIDNAKPEIGECPCEKYKELVEFKKEALAQLTELLDLWVD